MLSKRCVKKYHRAGANYLRIANRFGDSPRSKKHAAKLEKWLRRHRKWRSLAIRTVGMEIPG